MAGALTVTTRLVLSLSLMLVMGRLCSCDPPASLSKFVQEFKQLKSYVRMLRQESADSKFQLNFVLEELTGINEEIRLVKEQLKILEQKPGGDCCRSAGAVVGVGAKELEEIKVTMKRYREEIISQTGEEVRRVRDSTSSFKQRVSRELGSMKTGLEREKRARLGVEQKVGRCDGAVRNVTGSLGDVVKRHEADVSRVLSGCHKNLTSVRERIQAQEKLLQDGKRETERIGKQLAVVANRTVGHASLENENRLCPVKECLNRFVVFHQDQCYEIVNIAMNQKDAQAHCRFYGGNLVQIQNIKIQNVIVEHLQLLPVSIKEIWIGAQLDAKRKWTWVTGDDMVYSNWKNDTMHFNRFSMILFGLKCAVLSNEKLGQWIPSKCRIPRMFACQYGKTTTVTWCDINALAGSVRT